MIKQVLIAVIFIMLNILCIPIDGIGQNENQLPENKIGVSYSKGNQKWLKVDYRYETSSVNFTYYNLIHKRKLSEIFWTLEPTYSVSNFSADGVNDQLLSGYEVGISIGIRIDRKILIDNFKVITQLHTGPYYISDAPDRQIPGMLFSSGLDIGIDLSITAHMSMVIFGGFRHMSNGEVRLPNGGLNKIVKGLEITLRI